jgi:hypothetical protein
VGFAPMRRACLVPWLLLLGPGSVAAQQSLIAVAPSSDARGGPGCTVAASVLGAGAGMFLGGLIGYRIERAFYKGEDAGVTGLAVGMVFGAMGGIQLAKSACDDPDDDELRRQLRQPFDRPMSVERVGGRAEVARAMGSRSRTCCTVAATCATLGGPVACELHVSRHTRRD